MKLEVGSHEVRNHEVGSSNELPWLPYKWSFSIFVQIVTNI